MVVFTVSVAGVVVVAMFDGVGAYAGRRMMLGNC